jgi:hypothetical protein
MLGVEQHPVEAGVSQNFRRNIAAETRPDADLGLTRLDRLFELIDWKLHCLPPQKLQRKGRKGRKETQELYK